MTEKEQRQLDFNAYQRMMGLKEYDPGTVMFYEEQLDQKDRSDELEESGIYDDIDYDLELINKLFDPPPSTFSAKPPTRVAPKVFAIVFKLSMAELVSSISS